MNFNKVIKIITLSFALMLMTSIPIHVSEAGEWINYKSIEKLKDMCSVVCPKVPSPCWANCPICNGKPEDAYLYLTIEDQPWKMKIFRGDKYMCWGVQKDTYFHFKAFPTYKANGKRTTPVEPNPDPRYERIGVNYYLESPFRNTSMIFKFGIDFENMCPAEIQGSLLQKKLGLCPKDNFEELTNLGRSSTNVVYNITFWEHQNESASINDRRRVQMIKDNFSYIREKQYTFETLWRHYDGVARHLELWIPSEAPGGRKFLGSITPYMLNFQYTRKNTPIVEVMKDAQQNTDKGIF